MQFDRRWSQFTPPVAVNLYVTTQLADIRLKETFKSVWPMVVAMLLTLLIVVIFPQLSLWITQFLGLM